MTISQREIDTLSSKITNEMKLEMISVLSEHEKRMKESSREARNSAIEAVTGHSWENREKVRDIIAWAARKKEANTRNIVTLWAASIVVFVGAFWEHISSAWSGH